MIGHEAPASAEKQKIKHKNSKEGRQDLGKSTGVIKLGGKYRRGTGGNAHATLPLYSIDPDDEILSRSSSRTTTSLSVLPKNSPLRCWFPFWNRDTQGVYVVCISMSFHPRLKSYLDNYGRPLLTHPSSLPIINTTYPDSQIQEGMTVCNS